MAAFLRLEEQLKCPVCLDIFKEPRGLSCLHSFCRGCLENFPVQEDGTIHCPTCRHVVTLPPQGGLNQLPVAFHINTLLDLYQTLKNPASTVGNDSREVPMCPLHNKGREFYCLDDDEVICSLCIIRGHKNHNVDAIEPEYFKQVEENIIGCLGVVNEKIEMVENAVSLSDAKVIELEDQVVKVKREIHQEIERLHRQLEVSKENMLNQVDLLSRDKVRQMDARKETLQTMLAQLESCKDFVTITLQTSSHEQIVIAKGQIINHMQALTSHIEENDAFTSNNSGLFYNPPTTLNIDVGVACQVQINKCKIGNRRRFVGKIGEPASFLLEVRDINGQLTHLPNDCAISCLMDDTELNTQTSLKEKGNYKISFVPQNPGPHTVTCLIGSEHVNGSPFVCRVLPTSLLHHIKLIDNLDIPVGVAFTRQTNHTILAERGTRASNISILNERGEKIKSLGNQEFHTLSGVALDKEDNLFIVDSGRGCLCKYSMEGDNMAAVGIFDLPYSVAVHPNGTIFITERNNYRIQVFNQDLTFSYSFGSKGTQRGKFKVLFDIAIDSKGYVYASDPKLHRVQKFDELGNYVSSIQVNSPYFLSFDGQDILYVMEQREPLKQFFAVRPIFVVHHHFITIINCRGDDMMMLDEFQWSMYCPDYGCASNIAVNREGLLHICDPHNNCIYIC